MNAYSTKKVESAIKKVIHYYHFFDYAPSFELIYLFFPFHISKKTLQDALENMIDNHKLLSYNKSRRNMNLGHLNDPFDICHLSFGISLYTLPQYSMPVQNIKKQEERGVYTIKLLQKVKPYIILLRKIPFVRMVTITGSASMDNCKKNDDIDLLIITKSKSLWMTRFFCVVLAKIMRLYGKYVCLNMFFDESDLIIPKQKQTIYIGHELLQMKPVINKNNTYERMILDNKWIYSLFPNTRSKSQNSKVKYQISFVARFMLHVKQLIDNIFRTLQLPLIRKNKTALLITPTQLWLFRRDFEKKLRKM